MVRIVVVVLLVVLLPLAASAQLVRDHVGEGGLRGFHGPATAGRIKRSFQSDGEARAELERILSAVGLTWITDRVALRASAETDNAEAGIGNSGERFIFYNALFMQKLRQRTADDWSLISILAHELGHHLAFHTEIDGRWHEFELEADYFSGFVLRRLGATLDQAQAAMRAISPKQASETHPGLDQRLQAITIGWTDGGAQGAPRGLKKADEAAAMATAPAAPRPSRAEVAQFCQSIATNPSLAVVQSLRDTYRGTLMEACVEARIDELKKVALAAPPQAPRPPPHTSVGPVPDPRPEPVVGVFNPSRATAPLTAAEERALRRDDRHTGRSFRECPVCPEMIVVPAGSFTMGSPQEEKEREDGEGPQHLVTIARPFAIGKFEVTFAEWDACVAERGCRRRPGDQGWGRGKRPVINVSWESISKEYLPWLSRKTGKEYRLPTEAEWEYAARAGTTTQFWTGAAISTSQANFFGDKNRMQTVPADSFAANPWGLYNVHGNVGEWVQDCDKPNYSGASSDGSAWTSGECGVRTTRGGSWENDAWRVRTAIRRGFVSGLQASSLGFRVARSF